MRTLDGSTIVRCEQKCIFKSGRMIGRWLRNYLFGFFFRVFKRLSSFKKRPEVFSVHRPDMVCVCAHVCVCMRLWLVSFDITLLNEFIHVHFLSF